MNNTPRHTRIATAVATVLGALSGAAHAQIVVNDTLNGANSIYDWTPQGGACLTASSNPRNPPSNYIPGCYATGFTYYSAKNSKLVGGDTGGLGTAADPVGHGALRLTNGDTVSNGSNGNQQTGAVVSTNGFPMSGGVSITWTSVTYGGNAYIPSGYTAANGADGIAFFLADAAKPVSVGGSGGSLGYSCSNTNDTFAGVRGGYVAVGIDEYGNFANGGQGKDNTSTGPGFSPGLISMRGAGSTNWADLNADPVWSKFYPTSASNTKAIMTATCSHGAAYNASSSTQKDSKKNDVASGAYATLDPLPNYKYLTPPVPVTPIVIANQEAIAKPRRTGVDATPTTPAIVGATPISFSLNITPAGLLDFSYAINGGTSQPVFTKFDIVAANGLPLPASVRFGFSAGTGGGSNVHEITCFKAAPNSEGQGSAGSTAQPTAKVPGGAQIYLAFYQATNWYGTLSAFGVDKTTAAVSTTANWEANCKLTGGASSTCTATAPDYTKRVMLTYDDGAAKGVEFAQSSLPSSESNAFNTGDSQKDKRLDYLRGGRSNEVSGTTGLFRARTGLLGDIIDSSPVWVGPPNSPYKSKFVDALTNTAGAEGTSYATFAASTKASGRTNVVYVGANDGILHGFEAGTFDGTNYGGATNDGAEVLAFVPNTAARILHSTSPSLDFSSTAYAHNFFVDGTPGIGDLYYGSPGAWHTWLVSGLGAGGQANGPVTDGKTKTSSSAIFMLDVTDPTQFTASNAASVVLGEWTPSTIVCTNDTSTVKCGSHLGLTYGTPQIRRLHDGNWAVLFGNGLNSVSGTAGLFIGEVDSVTGKIAKFQYIDTGVGASAGVLNGIDQISPTDLDGDHITDFVYAGDALGNIWRFDLTAATASSWTVGSPLFTTSAGQPITTSVVAAGTPTPGASGNTKVIVAFGTGQKFPLSAGGSDTFQSGTQAVYGVWDWNFDNWNSKSATKFDSLSALPSGFTAPLDPSTLVSQAITSQLQGSNQYRTIPNSVAVCWYGTSGCLTSATAKFGWTLPLAAAVPTGTQPTLSEQMIFNPTVIGNELVFNTFIPASATAAALQCSTPLSTGYTMAVQLANGGAPADSFLPLPDGTFSTTVSVVGLATGAVGTPTPLTSGQGQTFIVSGTVTGGISETQTNITGGVGSRVNWTKVR